MPTEPQRRLRDLFEAALDEPADQRAAFLEQACNGDRQLLDAVNKLLRANERSAGLIDTPIHQRRELVAEPREPGSFIGPYKILQELNGGGMGVVYQAIRADEVFQRVCAIKVIRPELSTEWLVDRFRQERQILARLDHPHIARIVDGGSTPDGLPYFVMDFVDGPSIAQYSAGHDLSVRQRLALFQQACSAVQYLHDSGVIHGDLKPPNILVGRDGSVKLVDFGIASVLSAAEDQKQKSLPLMTPGYASPEQIHGQRVIPVSEVYTLGVILYELLTGKHPFQTGDRSRADLLEAITSEEPPPPSAVNATARDAATDKLSGDLDSIILKAMRRDPGQRYQSVKAMSDDIARYLQNRPVTARSKGLLYTSRKFFSRNMRAAVALASIVILLCTTCWQGIQLHRRYAVSRTLEDQVRSLQKQIDEDLKNRKASLSPLAAPGKGNAVHASDLQQTELANIGNLADAYRTNFTESVRLWPGMSPGRRNLLDGADRYLRAAEPFVGQDDQGQQQLAAAWMQLANLEGNPATTNLNDGASAASSIREAQRLIAGSSGASAVVRRQIEAAAAQIAGPR